MAYEQNSTYQPPRREYYDQKQRGPVQGRYGGQAGQAYDQYDQGYDGYGGHQGYDQYDQYDQGYVQGYEQPYDDRYDDYGQGMNGQQGAQYNDGHYGGYERQQRGNREAPRTHDRSYESHPQSRPPRGMPPGRGQQYQQSSERSAGRSGYQLQPQNRQKPNGPPPPMNQRGDSYDQRGADRNARPRAQDNDYPSRMESSGHSQQRDRGKMPMADWKAQERARMEADSQSPNYLPQDNAFPPIGKKKERPKVSDEANYSRSRPGDEQRRPRPPGGSRPESRDQRPAVSRDISYGDDSRPYNGPLSASGRPHVDRSASSDERRGPRQAAASGYGHAERPEWNTERSYQHQASDMPISSASDGQQNRWPLADDQVPINAPSNARMAPQANGYAQGYEQGVGEPQRRGTAAQRTQHPQQMPGPRQGPGRAHPQMQPIDTSGINHQQQHLYMDSQPLSPANLAPRPSTSHAVRPRAGAQALSPLARDDQSANALDYSAPKPWMQTQHTRHESLGDLYDDYGDTSDHPATVAVPPPPKTRDEEIEMEMPDFDSAAPGQTSILHKRQVNEAQAQSPPPPPPMPTTASPYSQPAQTGFGQGNGYQQTQYEARGFTPAEAARVMSPVGMSGAARGMQPNGPTQGYQYADEYPNPPSQRGPPNRPPLARGQSGRRSMDNTHQLPYRNGPPPPQRFYPDGQPIPPPQQRTPSAPPLQPGLRGPPAMSPTEGQPRPYGPPNGPPQPRGNNPDSLPHHPVPVRPGLMDPRPGNQMKPAPVRSYPNSSAASTSNPPSESRGSIDEQEQPVTNAELNRLRNLVEANPHNPKQGFLLVKRLVEASKVLASENGRADARMAAKNRDRYLADACKRVKRLASSGYSEAQFYLADAYGQGSLNLDVDTKEAFNLYLAAAKQGHGQAAYRTAVCCEIGAEDGGGTRRDYPKAVQWYRRAATLSDSAAMYKLGIILLKGLLGQQRNIGEAVTWLKRAADRADHENPHSLHELAMLYESNNVNPEIRNKVVADDQYALELFQKAARLGHKFSQFRLGQAYEYGNLGLDIDHRASISWYTKAAAQGEHQAELALSGWYLTGAEGILEHSDAEAYLWARKAAKSEPPLAKAMFAMGYFTETGIGCPASLEEAKKWYGRAACKFSPPSTDGTFPILRIISLIICFYFAQRPNSPKHWSGWRNSSGTAAKVHVPQMANYHARIKNGTKLSAR